MIRVPIRDWNRPEASLDRRIARPPPGIDASDPPAAHHTGTIVSGLVVTSDFGLAISEERERRQRLWDRLLESGGPSVAPRLVHELGIQRGQQGIYRNLDRTRHLTTDGSGVALSIRHTGSSYADELGADELVYHYPKTDRGQRDLNEIASLRSCHALWIPLFVVITPESNPTVREVRRGWIVAHDDCVALVSFEESPQPLLDPSDLDDLPFQLKGRPPHGYSKRKTRPGQRRFKFQVMKRYGRRCAVCDIKHERLLQAAHLCPVTAGGSDDARNGLVFCLNHHAAFDLGLLRIDPDSLAVRVDSKDSGGLGVIRRSIAHLPDLPHDEALRWASIHR